MTGTGTQTQTQTQTWTTGVTTIALLVLRTGELKMIWTIIVIFQIYVSFYWYENNKDNYDSNRQHAILSYCFIPDFFLLFGFNVKK